MKQRIITGAIGIAFMVVVLFFYKTLLLNFTISALSVIAVWEIFAATKYINNKPLLIFSVLFSFAVPLFRTPYMNNFSKLASFLYVAAIFVIMLASHKKIKLEQVGLVFMMTTILSFAFSSFLYLRDLPTLTNPPHPASDGLFYVLMVVIGAWVTDGGAYFVGVFFGKHKLAPVISPKKTIEGTVGGIVSNIIAFVILGMVYQHWVLQPAAAAAHTAPARVAFLPLIVMAVACSVAATLGDLAASYVKRVCDIKDFGSIMPGHGGILDRFDSFLLVSPMLYIVIPFFPVILR